MTSRTFKVLDKSSGLEPMGRPKNLKLEHFNMSSTFPAFSVRGVDGTIKVEDYFGKSFIVEDIKVEFYGPKPGSDGSRPEIPECEADLIVTRGTPDCLFMGYMLKGSGVYIARWGMDPIPELDYTESFPMRCYPTLYRDHGFTFLTLDDHNTPIWDELYGRVSYGGGDITLKRMLKDPECLDVLLKGNAADIRKRIDQLDTKYYTPEGHLGLGGLSGGPSMRVTEYLESVCQDRRKRNGV